MTLINIKIWKPLTQGLEQQSYQQESSLYLEAFWELSKWNSMDTLLFVYPSQFPLGLKKEEEDGMIN